MSSTMQPHDRLIRDLLSDPARAADYLASVLPEAISKAYDFSKLRQVPTNFVTPLFREKRADMLLHVPRRGQSAGQDPGLLLYVLFEHLSTPDGLTPLRLMSYEVVIWESWIRDLPASLKGGPVKLPPIVPVVLYQGSAAWRVPRELASMMNLDGLDNATREALMPYLAQQRYVLQDLGRTPDDDIGAHGAVRVALVVMKHVKSPELIEVLRSLTEELRQELVGDTSDLRDLRMILRYILMASEHVSAQQLVDVVEPLGEQVKEIAMTEGERLIAVGFERGIESGLKQGIEQGLEQGIARGVVEGRQEERRRLARKMLESGLDAHQVASLSGLSVEQVRHLQTS